MFDFSWSEIALVVIVALIFIKPKDLPVAMRTLSKGVKAVRRMASEFQNHVDDMVRDADLGEAREQFRDLKRLNLRERVSKVIDGDHVIRNGFDMAPRPPSLSAPPFSGRSPESPAPTAYDVPSPSWEAAEPEIDAPSILPPTMARRLSRERQRWYAPSIMPPPMVVHGNRRVALGLSGRMFPECVEKD